MQFDVFQTGWFLPSNMNILCWHLLRHAAVSLSAACQVDDIAASVSWRHVDPSKACRLAVARLKLSGRRSFPTVLDQICLGLPVLRRQSLGGPWMQAWKSREWSWLVSTRLRWPKTARRRRRIVFNRSGWPVGDRTTSLETNLSSEYGEYVWGTNYPMHQSSSLGWRTQTIP